MTWITSGFIITDLRVVETTFPISEYDERIKRLREWAKGKQLIEAKRIAEKDTMTIKIRWRDYGPAGQTNGV